MNVHCAEIVTWYYSEDIYFRVNYNGQREIHFDIGFKPQKMISRWAEW